MFLGIESNTRRDMLKMALNNFIEHAHKANDYYESDAVKNRAAELVAEAQHVLRVIAATENLVLNQHPTYLGVPTTHDNGEP